MSAIDQLALLEKIHKQGINVVTCGDCGTVMLVEREEDKHQCFDCGFTEDPAFFPDLFYEGWEDCVEQKSKEGSNWE